LKSPIEYCRDIWRIIEQLPQIHWRRAGLCPEQ
jgi:hypothetical protein